MREELFTLYEQELTFIRQMAKEFALQHPFEAGQLVLQPERCDDPHVERLIESFALLAARVRLKLEDEFPEITDALLQVLYPHYLAPVPSMAIAQLTLDPEQGRISTGYDVPRHQILDSKAGFGPPCRFRTCYPVALWPLEVRKVQLEVGDFRGPKGEAAPNAIVLRLGTQGNIAFKELPLSSLRFFLSGEDQLVHQLYEAIMGHCVGVGIRRIGASGAERFLAGVPISEVGFGKDEGLLPYSTRSHIGYRLLLEYFCFPRKFMFFDVSGLERLRDLDVVDSVELVFLLKRRLRETQGLDTDTFLLGCTPIVNLHSRGAENIHLNHARTENMVVADNDRYMEVYSVDRVTGVFPGSKEQTVYRPFYSMQHSYEGRRARTFWHATRRPSMRGEHRELPATEVYLTLVDLDLKAATPANGELLVEITCSNWDEPRALTKRAEFQVEGAASVKSAVCVTTPTPTMRPPGARGAQWPLISHLSLNYLSALDVDEKGSPDVLRAILELYDFSPDPAMRQQIENQIAGIVAVRTRQVMRLAPYGDNIKALTRGTEATIEFDESKYVESGLYLFSSVLEKFLALSVSINSFSETIAQGRHYGLVKKWPPRSGYQALI